MIRNIQILRAFAALSVVFLHINWLGLEIGGFGVDVFFVISGFIMAYILNRDTRRFFLMRLVRIVPMYWAVTLLLYAITLVAPQLLSATRADVPYVLASLFFIPAFSHEDLLHPLVAVGWTLNYEMFFYAVISLCLLFLPGRLAIGASAVLLIALVVAMRGVVCGNAWCHFLQNPIMLEFCLGIGVFHAMQKGWLRMPSVWLGLVLVACVVALPVTERFVNSLPTLQRVLIVAAISTALVASAIGLENNAPRKWKDLLIVVGNASYVMYLVHYFVIKAYVLLVNRHIPVLATDGVVGMVLCMVLVTCISIALHYGVERRVVQWLQNKIQHGKNTS